MSIKIITGTSSAEKQRFVIEQVVEDQLLHGVSGQPITYLFPQVSIAKKFAHDHVDGVRFQDASYSFNRWFEKVWEQYGSPAALVRNDQRELLFQEVAFEWASDSKGNLVSSKEYITLPGVRKVFCELLSSFGSQLIDENAKGITVSMMGPGAFEVISHYFDRIQRERLIEISDAMLLLAQTPINLRSVIVLDGFNNFSQYQLNLLVGLGNQNQFVISLNYNEDILFAQPLQSLISYLQNNGDASVEFFNEPKVGESAVQKYLTWRNNSGSNDGVVHKEALANGALSLSLAAGKNAEVAALGDEVLKSLESHNPGDIVVALRNAQRYAHPLLRYLKSHNVELAFDLVVPLPQTRFGAAILELFRTNKLLWTIMSPESNFDVQKPVRTHASFQTLFVNKNFEEFWLRDVKVRRNNGEAGSSLAYANKLLKEDYSGKSAFDALNNAVRTCLPSDWKILFDLCLAETLNQEDLTEIDIKTVSLAHHELLSLVSACTSERKDGEEKVNVAYLVRSVMAADLQFTRPQGNDCVLLTDAHRMRGIRTPVLVLGGLANDDFKATDGNSMAQELAQYLAPEQAKEIVVSSAADKDSLLLNDLLSSAQEHIALVGQCVSEDNKQRALIPFLEMITTSLDEDSQSRNLNGSIEDLRRHLEALRKTGVSVIDALNPHAVEAALTAGGACSARSSADVPIRSQMGAMRGETNLNLYEGGSFEDREFSPSALESYGLCPYGWFLSRYVSNNPLDKQYGNLESGTLVHKLLEEFYKAWNTQYNLVRIGADNWSEAERIFEEVKQNVLHEKISEVFDTQDAKVLEFASKVVDLAWNRIELDQKLLLSSGDQYFPDQFEVKLGSGVSNGSNDEEGLPARVGKLKIAGSIDRIDRNSEGNYFIIDYKGSLDDDSKGNNWLRSGKIQAGLYWLAYENATDNNVSGSSYISYKSDKRGYLFDSDLIDESMLKKSSRTGSQDCDARTTLDEIVSIAEQCAELMHEGNVKIAHDISINGYVLSNKSKRCDFCAFKACPARASKQEVEE